MALFRYTAQDPDGAPAEGTMDESSAYRVKRKLEERGLTVVSVEEQHRPKGLVRVSERLTWDEISLLTGHLKSIVHHGLPLPQSLGAMARELGSPRLQPVLEGLQKDLEQGRNLDEAVARQHRAFPRLYAPVLKAGEASGNLSAVLQMLARHSSEQVESRHALRSALAYPLFTLLFATGIVFFFLFYIVPMYAEVIVRDYGTQAPFAYRTFEALAQLSWAVVALPVVLLGVVLLIRWAAQRHHTVRFWADNLRLKLPIIGPMYYHAALGRFARTLGILLAARTPLLESLEIAAAASDSPLLEKAVETATLRVAAGERVAEGLEASGFFPGQFCWMVGVGEERNDLEEALEHCADSAERDAGIHTRALRTYLPPAVVALTGIVVVVMMLILYMPLGAFTELFML